MYEAETIGFSGRELEQLEQVQSRVGRLALGSNRFTAVQAIRGEMGCSTFDE